MQSKGKVIIFLVIFAFPIIAISANHQLFFGIIAAIMTIISLTNINNILKKNCFEEHEIDEELDEELEELVEIDIKKFGNGLSVVNNLISIVFLCYCSFYLETILLKALASFAILLQIYFIIKKTKRSSEVFDRNKFKPQILLASISNVTVVILTLYSKISQMN